MKVLKPSFLLAVLLWCSSLRAATVVVEMRNNFFSPASVTVNAGDTVTWVQRGANHNTVSYDGLWASPILNLNQTFSHTFNAAGTFRYFCTPHESIGMIGTITVQGAANTPPTVTLTAPTSGATFVNTDTITFSADASDNGSITKVDFFAGSTLIGTDTTAPYSVTGTLSARVHSITARATDNQGATTTSSAVSITVTAPNQPPTVNLTAPANGATFLATDTITFSADASDNGSVTKVEFFAGSSLIGADESSPFSVTGTLPAGTHSITAKATDNGGATTTSSAISITVNAPNQPPTVNLTAPANGATFQTTDTITFSADASDNGSVTKVEFFAGDSLIGTDESSPYSVTGTLAAGTHSITAKATDNAGTTTTSSAVSITVQSPSNQSPTVTLTASPSGVLSPPANLTLRAEAADPDGTVAQVEFFNGTTSLGTDNTAPFEISLNDQPAGLYSFTAVATDNSGARTTSEAVSVNISAGPRISSIARSGDTTTLNVEGQTGVPHILESSFDLISWSGIATNTPVSGSAVFTDSANQPSKFYRVVVR